MKQSFYEWIRRALDAGRTGILHQWTNAANKPTVRVTDCDPDAVTQRYADNWSNTWNSSQPNSDHSHPQAEHMSDDQIRVTLDKLRQQVLNGGKTSSYLSEVLDTISRPNIRSCLTQFNATTATGTDGLAISDLREAPDEAIDDFAIILRKSVLALIPPLQTLFTNIAAVPKKDPRDKRAVRGPHHAASCHGTTHSPHTLGIRPASLRRRRHCYQGR